MREPYLYILEVVEKSLVLSAYFIRVSSAFFFAIQWMAKVPMEIWLFAR